MATINQPSFTGGEFKPSVRQRVDISKYGVGCRVLRNYIIHAGGGISNRAGQRYICKAKYDDKNSVLVPFQFSTEQTYMLEFGDEYMRVYKDGALVLNSPKNITDVTTANPGVFSVTSHGLTVGDWIFIEGVTGMRELNNRFFIVASTPTSGTFTLTDLFGTVIDTTIYDLYDSGGTIASVYEADSPYAEEDLEGAYASPGVSPEKVGLVYSQSADVMTLTRNGYDVYELSRQDHDDWDFNPVVYAPGILPPAGTPALSGPATTGGTATYRYVITAINADGVESVASNAGSSNTIKVSWTGTDYIDISWSAVTGATKYNVYKDKNGFYGFIGPATGTTFRDDNIEPVVNDAPPEARDPFADPGEEPGTNTLHDQRRVFARTVNRPDTVFMSQTANYRNMNVSVPAKPSDALQFTIASEQVNAIKHLLSMGDLIAFTGNAEWMLAGTGDNAIGPSTISAVKQSSRGISHVRPLMIGETALIPQARGKKIRDFRYTIEADGYDGNDISILSSHLFRKTRAVDKRLKNWTYQQEPDSVVWCVHMDGSMSSLTYQREHEVWGWSRHDTDGKYLDICCIPEGDVDAIYMIVERRVNDIPRRFIERMENREVDEDDLNHSFYLDAGIQFDNNGFTTFYGLEHLNGKAVGIFADGSELNQQVVTGGKIDLDQVYTVVTIGLPYISDVQPLNIELNGNDGSTKGNVKKVPRVWVDVYNSRGLWAGPNENSLAELTDERTNENMGDPTRLQSKRFEIGLNADYNFSAAVFLRHQSPTPITILGITPDVEF